MKIPYFREVYMKNELPKSGPRLREAAIVNLDDNNGPGTHWVSHKKKKNEVIYVDSFGNLQPPQDLMKYFGVGKLRHCKRKS